MPDAPAPSDLDLPKIGRPATSALLHAGYPTLALVSTLTEAQLLSLHGVGPKAVRILREALAEKGLSFAETPNPRFGGSPA